MRIIIAILTLLACAAGAQADELVSPIRLPIVAVDPAPAPVPVPVPAQVTAIPADHFYVIESDVALLVLTSPDGLVSVADDTGPIRLRGRFAGGSGRVESRLFSSPHVYTIEGTASGELELLLVPVGAERVDQIVRTRLAITGLQPIPPPGPGPGPGPAPVDPPGPQPPQPPTPPPGPVTGPLQVLIIEETAERPALPDTQLHAMLGESVREYCKTHCRKSDGTTPDFRLLDDDADTSSADKWIRDAFALPRTSLPWIAVSNGTAGASQPLPRTPEETLALLRKYGGE